MHGYTLCVLHRGQLHARELCAVGVGRLCSFLPAMLIYLIFMLVESTIMLNTMPTVVAKIT